MIALKKLVTKKYQSPLPFQNDAPLNHTFTPFYNISDSLPLSGANKIHSPTYKKRGSKLRRLDQKNLLKMRLDSLFFNLILICSKYFSNTTIIKIEISYIKCSFSNA